MLLFQDKDYREERKKVQTIIHNQQLEQYKALPASGDLVSGRQRRQAAMLNYNWNEMAMQMDYNEEKKSKDEVKQH